MKNLRASLAMPGGLTSSNGFSAMIFFAERGAEKLFAPSHRLAHRCSGEALLQPDQPIITITRSDGRQISISPKKLYHARSANLQIGYCSRLHVRSSGNIGIKKGLQAGLVWSSRFET